MKKTTVGKFIAELRKEKNLTQKELAESLGVSDKTVSKWETCNGMPDVAILKPLCECLNISINELLSGERLSDERFMDKAEENILNLTEVIQKNESKRNITSVIGLVVGLLLLPLAICGLIAMSSPESIWGIALFSDITTFLYIVIFTVGILLVANKFVKVGKAVLMAFTRGKNSSEEEKNESVGILSFTIVAVLASGIISALLQVITFLSVFQSPESVGRSLAVLMLSLLYSILCATFLYALRGRLK